MLELINIMNSSKDAKSALISDIQNHTFRPEGPEKPTEWLCIDDINGMLGQYERTHPEFKFLGAVPIDCDGIRILLTSRT